MRDEEPALFERLAVILNPKDYLRYRLTGEIATEVSDASGTGLFDVRARRWSNALLDLAGIEHSLLPRCYESEEVSGRIGSAEFGLPAVLITQSPIPVSLHDGRPYQENCCAQLPHSS
jgi:xylulokinase